MEAEKNKSKGGKVCNKQKNNEEFGNRIDVRLANS